MRLTSRDLTIACLCLAAVLLMPVMAGCGGGTEESTPAREASEKATATEEETASTAAEMTEEVEPAEEAQAVTATLEYFGDEKGGKTSMEVPYLPPGRKVATIETEKGNIVIELWEDKAPNTVINFVYLANAGRYDGVPFHRVIDGFMAQTGDVEKKGGYGGPGYTIPAEFDPELKHDRGVVSMARSSDPNSAGSQFFIMLASAPHLNGQYAAFGEVIEGMDVVDAIKKGDKAKNGSVDDPDVMLKVRVGSIPPETEE
jgi:cyclophilin family peptidyl-prolyl cis-trans isomerase